MKSSIVHGDSRFDLIALDRKPPKVLGITLFRLL
jgi:hypothetical protein